MTSSVTDLSVITIRGVRIRACGALSAVVSGASIHAGARYANVAKLAIPGVAAAWLAALGDGITVLVKVAVNAASASAGGDALAPGGVGGVADFAGGAVLIAKAGGTGLAGTPVVAVLAFSAGVVGFADAAVLLTGLTDSAFGVADAFHVGVLGRAAKGEKKKDRPEGGSQERGGLSGDIHYRYS